MKILIDGYNLRDPYGSGIKYYGKKLVDLLVKNNISVSLLFDYGISDFTETQDAEFYNLIKNYNGDNINKLNIIKNLVFNKNLQYIDLKRIKYLIEESYLKNTNIINSPYIYQKSILKQKLGFTQKLDLKRIDIFHATYPLNINIKSSKKITTIHDLIPLKVPFVSLENKKNFYISVKKSLDESDKIITISEASKQDILEYFDVDQDKIVNTFQSVSLPKLSKRHSNQNNLKKFNLKKEEYFLFVGNIEPKKNLGRALDAFLKIDTNIKFVIVGKKAWMWKNELKYFDKKKMLLLSYVSRDELTTLFSQAKAFVFPSLYEGFGLPPLEAMSCNCPVITSNISSLPEVCKEAAIYCDPYNVYSIKEAMEKILNLTDEEREFLISKGKERVEFFNEDDYYNRIMSVYKSVL